ncbi:MAG: cytidylate kinase-like family protein [Lachnospiraceae bacterium]|nr:cytidylate kinase-like family protein [Lachnospiraceae bacterium]
MEQLIISVGRECGSGGHEIADKLAAHYNLKLYDRNLLREIAEERNLKHDDLHPHEEGHHNKLLYRTVKGMNSSPEHNVAQLQFEYLRKKADKGESFVVVGRCSETVLRDNKNLIAIFVLGDADTKIARLMKENNCSKKKAEEIMREGDKRRKRYHNSHCDIKWGDSRNYDISINACRIGVDEAVRILIDFIDTRKKKL